jgi:hypothetical protein
MTRTRLIQLSCLTLLLAGYLGSALPASATPDPPPGYYPSPAGPPPRPTVVHDHVSLATYVLVAGLAVVATLLVVALTSRLRRASADRRTTLRHPAAV